MELTIKKVDKICSHAFRIFGENHQFGEEINWHEYAASGYRWPLTYYRNIEIINLSDNSDIKFPWELNRFHYAVTLGKAYWYTGDEKYTGEMDLIDDIFWLISAEVYHTTGGY